MARPAEDADVTPPPVDTTNRYALSFGQNMPNHSESLRGRGGFVRQGFGEVPTFRTKQAAYSYAAYLITMAEVMLPDEDGCESHDFETILAAIRNS